MRGAKLPEGLGAAGEELSRHLALEAIGPHIPTRTIATKTRISEALVAGGLGPVFLR